ncbi:FxSxx-COOH cyclophane-containing RiPP peptide [Thermomonospora umbrina]|uniref:FXSXX-COOH protein n=1 Tax=Thermomonospora umbrina TaxID=111806 RepID=A0A3D9SHU3_9ACTN|nr:FxSxx-COOH cyclophane-containing RiPP peptide [Thermomonospora umbrina]REE95488.1 FXSXX-COOH protein [Thermomonospora umbrina]
MADADGEFESVLIDVSGLSLPELFSLDGTVLGEALNRVRVEAAAPREVVAGFQSGMYEPGA